MRRALLVVGFTCLAVLTASAQDPVKVDPKHHKVEFENSRVRILRINFSPHEKSVMHSHPDGVAVFVTDSHVRFNLPDGKTREAEGKAGGTRWAAAETHLTENLGDKPFEVILVELKAKPAAVRPAAKKKGHCATHIGSSP